MITRHKCGVNTYFEIGTSFRIRKRAANLQIFYSPAITADPAIPLKAFRNHCVPIAGATAYQEQCYSLQLHRKGLILVLQASRRMLYIKRKILIHA